MPSLRSHASRLAVASIALLGGALVVPTARAETTTSYHHTEDGPLPFAFAFFYDHDDAHLIFSVGDERDWPAARGYHARKGGDLVWARNGSRRYVGRSPELLNEIYEIVRPQLERSDEPPNAHERSVVESERSKQAKIIERTVRERLLEAIHEGKLRKI